MDYLGRVARGWLDSVWWSGLIVVSVLAVCCTPVSAQSGLTYAQAMAQCQANSPGWANQFNGGIWDHSTASCGLADSHDVGWSMGLTPSGQSAGYQPLVNHYTIPFVGSPPPDPGCSSVADSPGTWIDTSRAAANAGAICDTMDYKGTTQGKGCYETFTAGTGIGVSGGGTLYSGTYHATTATCTPNADGSFTRDDTSAPVPAPPAHTSNGQTAPRSCGGGSCVDPTTGQACIVDQGGNQFCTPVAAAVPPSSPNCYSDGSSATLCVGSPSPPVPSNPPVTDPAKQIASTDTYNVSTPTTSTTTTVNVYNTASGTTSSGQKSTDSGPPGGGQPQSTDPAHASSAGGNGTLSGGTDCNSPPICTGDSVLCGIARTQWATTCQVHRDLAGTSAPVPTTPPTASDLWQDGTATGDSEADNANQGNYNTSGFGYSQQCPIKDITFTLRGDTITIPMQDKCFIGPWLRALVLGFAFFAAARITAGGVS